MNPPSRKVNDSEQVFLSAPEQTDEHTIETPVIFRRHRTNYDFNVMCVRCRIRSVYVPCGWNYIAINEPVMTWFSAFLAICEANPVLFLVLTWINYWTDSQNGVDLSHYDAHLATLQSCLRISFFLMLDRAKRRFDITLFYTQHIYNKSDSSDHELEEDITYSIIIARHRVFAARTLKINYRSALEEYCDM